MIPDSGHPVGLQPQAFGVLFMDQSENKWWWLPGALLAVAGLLFLATAGLFGSEEVWVPVGLGFVVVSAFVVHRARPRDELEAREPAKAV